KKVGFCRPFFISGAQINMCARVDVSPPNITLGGRRGSHALLQDNHAARLIFSSAPQILLTDSSGTLE
ncbi:TPA: hypothetical protein ACT5B2_003727, partial [Burkholderia cenocepacia]